MKKYVFDLDNTLVYTDDLNSESYNYALRVMGKQAIVQATRITRKDVFSKYLFSEQEKDELIRLKQDYFRKNINKVIPNTELLNTLIGLPVQNCLLWTSAEKCRVDAVLECLDIAQNFTYVFYSDKSDIKRDLFEICKILKCEKGELYFYEFDKIKLSRITDVVKG